MRFSDFSAKECLWIVLSNFFVFPVIRTLSSIRLYLSSVTHLQIKFPINNWETQTKSSCYVPVPDSSVPYIRLMERMIDLFKNVVLTAQTLIDYSFKKNPRFQGRTGFLYVPPEWLYFCLVCLTLLPLRKMVPLDLYQELLKRSSWNKLPLWRRLSRTVHICIRESVQVLPGLLHIECRAGWFVPCLTELLVVPISHKNLHNCGTLLTESLKKKKKSGEQHYRAGYFPFCGDEESSIYSCDTESTWILYCSFPNPVGKK